MGVGVGGKVCVCVCVCGGGGGGSVMIFLAQDILQYGTYPRKSSHPKKVS